MNDIEIDLIDIDASEHNDAVEKLIVLDHKHLPIGSPCPEKTLEL